MQLDLPEYADVIVDVPLGGFVKRSERGSLDFVSPLPCPFNYGSVPGTLADDGDRVDALVLGGRIKKGAQVRVPVRGVVHFVDAGHADPKWICCREPLSWAQRSLVAFFFFNYANGKRLFNWLKGTSGPTRYQGLQLRD